MPLQETSGAASYDAFGGGVPYVPTYIEEVFSTWLYTGTRATLTITNGIDLSTKGGLVWIKERTQAGYDHALFDTARGVNKQLKSNTTAAEVTYAGSLTAFNTTGFTLGADSAGGYVNDNLSPHVSWTFREQAKFFDVVTYTGDGVAGRTVAHNLGSAPGVIIVKRTDGATNWRVYHRSLGATQYLDLDETNAAASATTIWNDTAPTSTVFSVGTNSGVNASGGTYVAYVFAHNAGGFGLTGTDNVISCGSYTGNGSTTGPLINLGWEPQWLLVKQSSISGAGWYLIDTMRGATSSGTDAVLFANTSGAETSDSRIAINATGFQPIQAGGELNASGETCIYIAIRRGPMKTPTTGTSVFTPVARTGTGAAATVTTNFPPDLLLSMYRSGGVSSGVWDRLRGVTKYLETTGTQAEDTSSNSITLLPNTAYVLGSDSATDRINRSGYTYANWVFGRAPGFFDVVCYTGTGTNTAFNHNLGVTPEMIITKIRNSAIPNWGVWNNALSPSSAMLFLNTTGTQGNGYVDTVTSTTFSFATANGVVNSSGNTYVAYLFATVAGVSKVGSYAGTGGVQTVNCGFTGGSRFVLIRRADSTGNWYVWDSARGIVAGNDPYLRLNSTAAEVTNTDYIDTASSGFEISSTAPAEINAANTWTSRTSGFGTTAIRGITYGNSLFVAVGVSGTLTTSSDGITWTSRTSGFGSTSINDVTYGGGVYVAVGESGTLTTSTNGTTWTSRTSGFGTTIITDVVYGGGLFVAVGDSGKLTTSSDGTTWTARTSGFGTTGINAVTYGNGLFVAVGDSGVMTTSPDGITWTSRTSGFSGVAINDVTYGNGLFVAVGNLGGMTTSSDGITWTSRTSGFSLTNISAVTYGGGLYMATGPSGTITASTSGTANWTSQANSFGSATISTVTTGNGLFVAGGSGGTLGTSSFTQFIFLAIA